MWEGKLTLLRRRKRQKRCVALPSQVCGGGRGSSILPSPGHGDWRELTQQGSWQIAVEPELWPGINASCPMGHCMLLSMKTPSQLLEG